MRKIFLSTSLIQEINRDNPTQYVSDDFKLAEAKYLFPVSYIIDNQLEDNDKIVVITGVVQTKRPKENYELYKQEIRQLVAKKAIHVDLEFIEIKQAVDFDSLTFNKFFKDIITLIQDDDLIFTDITFGMKCYSLSMFIALAYVTKAGKNINVDTIIYAQKYTGKKNEENISKIYDITGLFSLNTLASNAQAGQKEDLDSLLDFIID